MRGRETSTVSARVRLLGIALLAVLLAAVVAAPAIAKKKERPPAVTRSASTPLAPTSQTSATATCPGKTHVTGGGWSISNPYSANGTNAPTDDTGARITHLQSQPAGFLKWTAGAAAFAIPPNPTTFTSYARCENKAYGATLFGVSATTTVPIGQESTNAIHCPGGSHVLTAGFSFTPADNLAGALGAKRAMVVESRRTARDTWEIDLVNPDEAASQVTLSLNVLCELNRKGGGVSEASSVSPIADNGRTTATATCTGKTHSVAGGFLISPLVGPAIGIDQMQPVGRKSWQVGLYEYPTFVLPAGTSLTAYSYCKKNALPKKD